MGVLWALLFGVRANDTGYSPQRNKGGGRRPGDIRGGEYPVACARALKQEPAIYPRSPNVSTAETIEPRLVTSLAPSDKHKSRRHSHG